MTVGQIFARIIWFGFVPLLVALYVTTPTRSRSSQDGPGRAYPSKQPQSKPRRNS